MPMSEDTPCILERTENATGPVVPLRMNMLSDTPRRTPPFLQAKVAMMRSSGILHLQDTIRLLLKIEAAQQRAAT